MKALAAITVGCLVLAGCATLRPGLNQNNHYGVVMSSQLPHAEHMTLRFDGKEVCSGEIAKNAPVKCDAVAYPPRQVKVTWSASPDAAKQGGQRIVPINWFYQLPPRWFRTGDVMHFTLTRFHRLSVVFVCHRPGNICTSYPPYTGYGKPLGYDLGYTIGKAQ